MTRVALGVAIAALSLTVPVSGARNPSGPLVRPAEAARRDSGGKSYGWPVRPFFRQHSVRGTFGDPRIGPGSDGRILHSLHTGVDVVAPDGTPVYATTSGVVSIDPLHDDVVLVADDTGRVFEYWHVLPTMQSGRAIAYETEIGRVERPWAHVHLAERVGSTYLNPLRPGAMKPYTDNEAPQVAAIRLVPRMDESGRITSGTMDVVVDAFDRPARPVAAPWDRIRLTPAELRWRILDTHGRSLTHWCTSFDARAGLPTAEYTQVYAPGTRQNRASHPGWYRFFLIHDWIMTSLPKRSFFLEVSAVDIRGNETHAHAQLVLPTT